MTTSQQIDAAATACNQPTQNNPDCGVMITTVRISNFRSLENVEVSLDDLTVLVGANNSGKTSFLDALYAAIGAGRSMLGKDDIHLKVDETDIPLERKAVIDLLVKPYRSDGQILESFPAGSFWTTLWGEGISQDDDQNDFVGIRTMQVWSSTHGEYRIERKFLKEWKSFSDDWLVADVKDGVSSADLEPISLHYMDAQRDIEEDLRSRGSFWRRLTNDLGLPDDKVADFERTLSELNQQIVDNSDVLHHLRDHLVSMDSVVTAEQTGIDITPIARRLRDLSKGVDITFATKDAQSFPLSRHGMGTRSLASILVFRAFASWKRETAKQKNDQIHTVLALEEPEAHLHPQAQRSLFSQIKKILGQRIISTHSPYFAGQASLDELRLFQKQGSQSIVSRLDTSSLQPDDKRKLEHQIIQTRGDLLFCRALVFFEGPTEELSLPVYAKAFWGSTVHELGFNFVPVGGTDYFPLIWLANNLDIKWYVFSDGEKGPIDTLNKGLAKAGIGDAGGCDNIFILPNGKKIEEHLIHEGYLPEVEEVLKTTEWKNKDLDEYIRKHQGEKRKKNEVRDYTVEKGREIAAIDALSGNKTDLAIPVASSISKTTDPGRRFPSVILDLLRKMSEDFGWCVHLT